MVPVEDNVTLRGHNSIKPFFERLVGRHLASSSLPVPVRPFIGNENCRTVSEDCSVRVSRVGLSTGQAIEPDLDNPLNRTWIGCTRRGSYSAKGRVSAF